LALHFIKKGGAPVTFPNLQYEIVVSGGCGQFLNGFAALRPAVMISSVPVTYRGSASGGGFLPLAWVGLSGPGTLRLPWIKRIAIFRAALTKACSKAKRRAACGGAAFSIAGV
jgi:hypothetical protein